MLKRNPDEIYQLFYNLKTRQDVADLLEIKDKNLRFLLYKIRPENSYGTFKISKKGGGFRTISSPNKYLKNIQRKLLNILTLIYKPKVSVHGFVNGRNIISNAKCHSGHQVILNLDLKDFFQQIHFGRLRGMFTKPPYSLGDGAALAIAHCVFKWFIASGSSYISYIVEYDLFSFG